MHIAWEVLDIGRKPAGEILPGRDVIQVFTATVDELAVVAPQIATYRRRAHGKLRVSLHRVNVADSPRGILAWRSWPAIGRGRRLGAG